MSKQGRGRERRPETESQKGSALPARSTTQGLNPEQWDHGLSQNQVRRLTEWASRHLNVCLFSRERERERESESASSQAHMQVRGRQRGGDREDRESKVGSTLISTKLDMGLELRNCEIMTWAEVRCSTDWAMKEPHPCFNFKAVLKRYVYTYFHVYTYLISQ